MGSFLLGWFTGAGVQGANKKEQQKASISVSLSFTTFIYFYSSCTLPINSLRRNICPSLFLFLSKSLYLSLSLFLCFPLSLALSLFLPSSLSIFLSLALTIFYYSPFSCCTLAINPLSIEETIFELSRGNYRNYWDYDKYFKRQQRSYINTRGFVFPCLATVKGLYDIFSDQCNFFLLFFSFLFFVLLF